MAPNVLEIRNLSVDFTTDRGALQAVRQVSFDVPAGEIVGLVGESGCGKSTLASVLIRLTADNAVVRGDAVRFGGEDLLTLSAAAMRALRGERITMIFQDPMTALNPVLTIGRQMVDIQLRRKDSASGKRRRAAAMLDRVGIPDATARLDRYPHEFSGGMRQRICIAMALLSEPELIIADEPTTALDVTLEAQIVDLLKDLQQSMGLSIVCVSHHLGMIAELCHRVVVMYAGEVVESGPVGEIFHRAGHPYTQRLLACDPANIREPSDDLPTIAGEIPDLVDLPTGCIFRPRCHLAVDQCRREAPATRRIGPDHWAACHLLEREEYS